MCVREMWGRGFFKEGTQRTGKPKGKAPPPDSWRRHWLGLQGYQGAELTVHPLQDAENLGGLVHPQQLETKLKPQLQTLRAKLLRDNLETGPLCWTATSPRGCSPSRSQGRMGLRLQRAEHTVLAAGPLPKPQGKKPWAKQDQLSPGRADGAG